MKSRDLHSHIRRQIVRALGERSWSWLAREARIARSTLSDQAGVPRFSLVVLVKVARALDRDLHYFLPPDIVPTRARDPEVLLEQLRHYIRPPIDLEDEENDLRKRESG